LPTAYRGGGRLTLRYTREETMKQCPNCGKSLQDDVLFCSQCGTEIITDGAAGKRVCIYCGNELRNDEYYCSVYGE
jgi:predicted nucleic acid-binding Zn ribbon protein